MQDTLEPVRTPAQRPLLIGGHAGVPDASSRSGIEPLFPQPEQLRSGRLDPLTQRKGLRLNKEYLHCAVLCIQTDALESELRITGR